MTPGQAYHSLPDDDAGEAAWTVFAAGGVLAAFDPETPLETVVALWRLASAPDATIESVVAAIPTRGPAAVASFAVVIPGPRTTVVVRGRGGVDLLTGSVPRRIDSRNMQPWYLAEFEGVHGVVLGSVDRPSDIAAGPTDEDLPLLSGVLRTAWLGWSSGEARPAADAVPSSRAAARSRRAAANGSSSAGSPGGVSTAIAPAAPPPRRTSRLLADSGEIPPMPASPPPTPPGGDTADLDDTVRGVGTALFPGSGSARDAERAADLARAGQDGDIGDTIVAARRRHRADVPPLTSWSPARIEFDPRFGGEGRATGYYCFRIGDGQVYRLDTPVYVGRKPSSPRIITGSLPRLIKVESPQMEVSSTHLEVRQEGNSVVVTDMRSTNGTFVSQPGAAPVKLRQGESMVVTPGTLVDLGDGNILEILPVR